MLMSSIDYRESLRGYRPKVFVRGQRVESVADEPLLMPGINAIGLTYDYALHKDYRELTRAIQFTSGKEINRLMQVTRTSDDLLDKLELVRLICQDTGCAMRYLTMDGLNALYQSTFRTDDACGTDYHQRLLDYMHRVQEEDLTIAIAMTDAKGGRSLRPHQQSDVNSYVHIVERRTEGVVISGTKAIVTSAPYVHELFVLPGRAMTKEDKQFTIACAVPVDTKGLTIIARPAGRPGEAGALFTGQYGQSTGVCVFDRVFVPYERVFLCGEWEHAEFLTKTYANHHRHTCIGARAGFGDLLIGAGAYMVEANGLDLNENGHLRDTMVELIKTVESFYACGVAASVYAPRDAAGNIEPEPNYASIGKLLLATKIYDMHRLAHTMSGGLVVTLPSPEEDHNPDTAGDLSALLSTRPDIPHEKRVNVARFVEDLTASRSTAWYSVISLHDGGSPEAMKREIFRSYPIADKTKLVERLMERGVLSGQVSDSSEPGQCCDMGCVDSTLQRGPKREAVRD
jgi:4-hydroxybutyryl-CoA dehydratase/vinylacetyl-CoA-Delta-isomerase